MNGSKALYSPPNSLRIRAKHTMLHPIVFARPATIMQADPPDDLRRFRDADHPDLA
jgi:hypothetical protein